MVENNYIIISPEQNICITCGFCCDGTLFNKAVLQAGEYDNLPVKIKQNYFKQDDNEYFKLPCLYFDNLCTIYHQQKADICSSFRCQLLKDFSGGKITMDYALTAISNAKKIKEELFTEFRKQTGSENIKTIRGLLREIGKIQDKKVNYAINDTELELFTAKCNIFESLLIKHFKSEKDFSNLIMSPDK